MNKRVIAILLSLILTLSNLGAARAMASETYPDFEETSEEQDSASSEETAMEESGDTDSVLTTENAPDNENPSLEDEASGQESGEGIVESETLKDQGESSDPATPEETPYDDEASEGTPGTVETSEASPLIDDESAEASTDSEQVLAELDEATVIEEPSEPTTATNAPSLSGDVVYSEAWGDNLTWTLTGTGNELTMTVSGTGEMRDGQGYYPWREYQDRVVSIVIEEGVTSIAGGAFWDFSNVDSLELPNTLTYIGNSAFRNIDNLESVEIPNSVTELGEGVFALCSALFDVKLPEYITSIPNGTFSDCDSLVTVELPDDIETIGNRAFSDCDSLSSLDLPYGLKSIGNSAFTFCISLGSIALPDTVTELGESAFAACNGLHSIDLGHGLKFIRESAFEFCNSLQSISIPESTEYISNSAFHYCSNLQSISVDENNQHYESIDGVLYNKQKTLLMKCPAKKAFNNYVIPDTVTEINEGAFQNCSSIKNYEFPDGLQKIGNEAFFGNDSITSVVIPEGVNYIGTSAFFSCDCLATVTVPSTVKNLLDKSFAFCDNLSTLYVYRGTAPSTASSAFSSVSSSLVIHVPENAIGYDTLPWTKYTVVYDLPPVILKGISLNKSMHTFKESERVTLSVITDPEDAPVTDEATWTSDDEAIATVTSKGRVTAVSPGTTIIRATLREFEASCTVVVLSTYLAEGTCGDNIQFKLDYDGTLVITGQGYMQDCSNHTAPWYDHITEIKKVVISDEILSIAAGAFEDGCNITSVTIPSGAEQIGDRAFYGCQNIESLTISDLVTEIGTDAFNGVEADFYIKKGSAIDDYLKAEGKSIIYTCDFGHVWDDFMTVDRPPTCVDNGSESIHCSVCGVSDETTSQMIPAYEHPYSDWIVTLEPTCTERGSKKIVCPECGDTVVEPIPATGHKWNDFYTTDRMPTYDEEGIESIHCSVCDAMKEGSERSIPVLTNKPLDQVEITGITDMVYTGSPITQNTVLTDNGRSLEIGTDYTLEYENNINVGKATITITGIGMYTGVKTENFLILPGATTKVTCKNVASGIKISWNKVEGATRYYVYRDDKLLFKTSVLDVCDKEVKLNSGEKYVYKVIATTTGVGDSPKARTATMYRLLPVGIKSLTNPSAGKMTVTYDRCPGCYGYVVRYGLKSDMSDAKVVSVQGENTLSRTFAKLKKGKTYYVQVRTYMLDNGVRYYSGYCTTKTLKITK